VPAVATGVPRALAIVAIVLSLTAVNIVGVRDAALVGNVFTIGKLVPLAIFAVAGMFFLDADNFTPGPLPAFDDFSVAVLLLVYAFSAYEQITVAGGEARDPRRDVPHALLTSIVVVTVIYVAIQVVAIGTLPGLATSARPLTDSAARFLGAPGAVLVTVGALISIYGNLNVIMLVGPRIPFAMAARGELPALFARTHRSFHTPHVSIVITAAIVLGLALSGTFVYAATVSVIARLLCYAGTCAALPALRRRSDVTPAAFVVPGGTVVAAVALALVAWLLAHSTLAQARDAAIAAAAGMALYWTATRRRRAPRLPERLDAVP
jgi:amino acid transporter